MLFYRLDLNPNQPREVSMYNVVFKTIVECATKGAITWSAHKSKEYFDKWYDEKMRSWYEVVEQGVTEERAIELCSSPEAALAVLSSVGRRIDEVLSRICAD